MKSTVAFLVGVLAWTFAVFVGTLWMTFPSESLSQRIEYEVPRLLGDQYIAEVGSVSPWWVGLSVSDVKLYELPAPAPRRARRNAEEGDEGDESEADASPQLVAMLGNARVRASLWSLLRRAPYVTGAVRLTDGEIAYAVGTAADEDGEIGLADLIVTADQLPLGDLMLLLPLPASGTGAIDIDIDLHAGEDGMRDATGRIALSGSDLTLTDLELPTIGPLGMDIPLNALSLNADISGGRATITNGAVDSELFQLAITGEVTLREPIDRSAIDLTITLSQLGDSLAVYSTWLGSAETGSGTYQYNCRGVIARLNGYSCTPAGTRGRGGVSSRVTPGGRAPPSEVREVEGDADRQRRREELRARLQERREEREAQRPVRSDVQMDDELDDEEEFLEDEEEEEILDDEEWEDEIE